MLSIKWKYLFESVAINIYVLEFANTGGGNFAKARVQDVIGPRELGGNAAAFILDEYVASGTNAGKIKEVIKADLKYTEIPKYTGRNKKTFMLRYED